MTDDAPRSSLPALTPAVKALVLANAAVFVANMLLLGRLSDAVRGEGGQWFAFSWPGLFDAGGLGALRVLTYQFTHSFHDPLHLLLNLLVLWFFGPMAEQRLGRGGTVRLYLWGGFAGAVGHLAVAALQGQAAVPLVGASGACYAFLLHAACVAPHARVWLLFVPVPLWGLAALLLGLGLYQTFVELATGFAGGVSHGAHLGGALLGVVAHRGRWFAAPAHADLPARPGSIARLLEGLRRRRASRAQRAAAARELQLDVVLAKVKSHGLTALTPDERRFLERASERARSGGG